MSPALVGRFFTTEPSEKSTLAVIRINTSLDGKISWRREWLPTPVFWPGEFHGQMSLADDSPWGGKESDTTKWLSPSLRYMETKLNIENLSEGKAGYCEIPLLCITPSLHLGVFLCSALSFTPLPPKPELRKESTCPLLLHVKSGHVSLSQRYWHSRHCHTVTTPACFLGDLDYAQQMGKRL